MGRSSRFRGSAAVIGNQDTVEATVDREARVLAGIDAFDKELQFCRFSQLVDKLPGHGGILSADTGHVDPVVHLPFLDGRTLPAFMTRHALAEILRAGTQVGFTVAARGVIDGERNYGTPCGFDAPHDFLACVPGGRSIQLVPHRPAVRAAHILHRGRGGGRKHLHRSSGFGGARDCDFAVRMKGFLAASGAREDRAVVHRAEQLSPHIDFGRIAKPARTQLDVLESLAVGAESYVEVHSASHVRPVAGQNLTVRGFLEIQDVESFFRIADHISNLRRLLREGADPPLGQQRRG